LRVSVQRAKVHRGEHCYSGEVRVPAALVSREEPSEAVANQDEAPRVDAVLRRDGRIAREPNRLGRVFDRR
jgi:hypothetical protein